MRTSILNIKLSYKLYLIRLKSNKLNKSIIVIYTNIKQIILNLIYNKKNYYISFVDGIQRGSIINAISKISRSINFINQVLFLFHCLQNIFLLTQKIKIICEYNGILIQVTNYNVSSYEIRKILDHLFANTNFSK
ncbi:hypothetical protein pb186bvf_014836 [Paramecium bursaria]